MASASVMVVFVQRFDVQMIALASNSATGRVGDFEDVGRVPAQAQVLYDGVLHRESGIGIALRIIPYKLNLVAQSDTRHPLPITALLPGTRHVRQCRVQVGWVGQRRLHEHVRIGEVCECFEVAGTEPVMGVVGSASRIRDALVRLFLGRVVGEPVAAGAADTDEGGSVHARGQGADEVLGKLVAKVREEGGLHAEADKVLGHNVGAVRLFVGNGHADGTSAGREAAGDDGRLHGKDSLVNGGGGGVGLCYPDPFNTTRRTSSIDIYLYRMPPSLNHLTR